ncbi:SUKH-4 family immunity protein [Glycomyces sp. TRM65418]|uniref:SUKH-4 family immunity protein n=1 Tax=Glycomyces sp. TRM65418 TaxID=2867006 RepID=UPI001CE64EA4|nr:SUKH-4 family immunity protein [Glycomyces sp. TRM65418]MCC3763966.1 SUKH-4 family immunity protein [Glycomyces sp. TRM65418]QZD53665.1 SUKH-4 family immunity protein [Glycomyces sp. TRM65418]
MDFPREKLIEGGVAPESLPEDLEGLPESIPRIYTSRLPEGLAPFNMIRLTAEGTDLDVRLIVVGAVEGSPGLLYAIDPNTGEVLQFDTDSNEVRGVNSSYRWFVEFLRRIGFALEMSETDDIGSIMNRGMRFTLRALDERAFDEAEWWPLVFERLDQV